MTKLVVIAAALLVGAACGYLLGGATIRRLRRRIRELRSGSAAEPRRNLLRSITKLIFVTTQISALVWVFTSYGIAIYSTIRLGQVYTMAELSEPAIHTILGVSFLKVLENIFEHNDGTVFGRSKGGEAQDGQPGGGEEPQGDGTNEEGLG